MNFAAMEAAELSRGYLKRSFSPLEVTVASLDRLTKLNPRLNAFYLVDPENAIRAAEASTRRWISGTQLSQLDGVPTSIKDALPSTGHPSFRGSAAHALEDLRSDFDAPVVARMREAGMVFLGKTTMPDFGILPGSVSSKHGITRNPWNTEYSAGGSSSGAASSIAAGINPIVVGTDIVGSIRLPASFCGLFGLKPSQGRVPYYFPNSPSLVAGPMARCVTDAAMLMNCIVKPDSIDFTALPSSETDYVVSMKGDVAGKRVGVIDSVGFGVEPDEEVLSVFVSGVNALETAGFKTRRLKLAFTRAELREAERFYKARCRVELNTFPPERQQQASVILGWSAEAETMSATDLFRAFNCLQKMRERAARLIDGYDFLLLPSVPKPAFRAELSGFSAVEPFEPWINTFLFNLTEQPASSVPCGYTKLGLPVGLQIVGQRFDDIGVFRLSRVLEELLPTEQTMKAMIAELVA
jgi:Asp-tRNA(Asn)/Glu-tRNA(Gln) amidotransferase A subunit family amidase